MRSYYFLITLMSICVISNTIQAQNKKKKSFKPGTVWVDNNGKTINAHGGGIIYVDGIYYWYGEQQFLVWEYLFPESLTNPQKPLCVHTF